MKLLSSYYSFFYVPRYFPPIIWYSSFLSPPSPPHPTAHDLISLLPLPQPKFHCIVFHFLLHEVSPFFFAHFPFPIFFVLPDFTPRALKTSRRPVSVPGVPESLSQGSLTGDRQTVRDTTTKRYTLFLFPNCPCAHKCLLTLLCLFMFYAW